MDTRTDLSSENLSSAKWAFTTRRVQKTDARGLSNSFCDARSGDLLLAEVLETKSHKRLQLASGRASTLFPGDRIVVCVGDRYAPDQFEGVGEISAKQADLIASGGLAGRMREKNASIDAPTTLKPIGMLCDRQGETLNIASYALPARPAPAGMIVIGVVGASMNSGKTTTTMSLAHGFKRSGLRVATIKATGTGAFGDYNQYIDAGADFVADFTDVGMASTYLQPIDRIVSGQASLLAAAAEAGCAYAIVELADGLFQRETAAILEAQEVRDLYDGFMLATADALSATGGVLVLNRYGIRPLAISGKVSMSPLAVSEAVAQTGVPILSREALCSAQHAGRLADAARLARARRKTGGGLEHAAGRESRFGQAA